MNMKHCVHDLLMAGADDWVYLAEAVRIVESNCGSEVDVRKTSLDLIREVIQRERMEIGDVDEKGFRQWGLPCQEALHRIEREWKALERNPSLGEICWLQNTKRGDEIGSRLLDQGVKGTSEAEQEE